MRKFGLFLTLACLGLFSIGCAPDATTDDTTAPVVVDETATDDTAATEGTLTDDAATTDGDATTDADATIDADATTDEVIGDETVEDVDAVDAVTDPAGETTTDEEVVE